LLQIKLSKNCATLTKSFPQIWNPCWSNHENKGFVDLTSLNIAHSFADNSTPLPLGEREAQVRAETGGGFGFCLPPFECALFHNHVCNHLRIRILILWSEDDNHSTKAYPLFQRRNRMNRAQMAGNRQSQEASEILAL
jgi:hypothetical protein